MILNFLFVELGEGTYCKAIPMIDCDWLVSVTGNLDGTFTCSEATGFPDISLSEDCSGLIFAVSYREAMVVLIW